MPLYKQKNQKNKAGEQKYLVRINYNDNFGTPRQLTRTAYGLQAAKMLEMTLQSEQKGTATLKTFAEITELYFSAKKFEVRETSYNKTLTVFKTHLTPFFQNFQLNKINVKTINEWKIYINNKECAFRTKKNIFSELRTFFHWCVKNGHLSESPLKNVDNFRDAYAVHEREKLRYYTAEQFKQFIKIALEDAEINNNFDFYIFFNIAFFTGLRKGEINALSWEDLKDNKITVSKSINQKLSGNDRLTPPKNLSSHRTLQLPKNLIQLLLEHKKRQQLKTGFKQDFYICGGERCLRDTSIDKKNRKISELAELPRITIHEYRHSHASLLANAGINIQEISRRLGHSKVEQTWNTYSHLYPHEEERAVTVLENL